MRSAVLEVGDRFGAGVMRGRRLHVDDLVRRENNGRGRWSFIGRISSCVSRGGGCEEEDRDGRGGLRQVMAAFRNVGRR
ncbi:uncharacterized protein [Physcomitrium patens]|uniref:uncharacterized protein isoform X2 n=1 Tax=Physcomitrium patens TaxID=3218 RepID=UPI003CCD38AF